MLGSPKPSAGMWTLKAVGGREVLGSTSRFEENLRK